MKMVKISRLQTYSGLKRPQQTPETKSLGLAVKRHLLSYSLLIPQHIIQLLSSSNGDQIGTYYFFKEKRIKFQTLVLAALFHRPSSIHVQREWHLIIHAKMQTLIHSMNN